jgi:hypothetical protein
MIMNKAIEFKQALQSPGASIQNVTPLHKQTTCACETQV